MTRTLLGELDNRLSLIKRWAIVPTIQTQSVAEHQFNVQRIVIKLASWFDLTESEDLFDLSQAALHHDDREALSGDIPQTAKYFVKEGESGIDTGQEVWYDEASPRIKAVVKLADLLEGIHFLTMEIHLGNKYVELHQLQMIERVLKFVRDQTDWPKHVYGNVSRWIEDIRHRNVSERFEPK